jgi:flavin reductase (DIM6/NTAB) family NADH-FMN oxidoreductase RutF
MLSFTHVRSLAHRSEGGSTLEHAEPSPTRIVDAERLRAATDQFGTGVTVITTRDAAGHTYGSTAKAVSLVSLRPPLVLACLHRESEALAAVLESRRFAINVLHGSQAELWDRSRGAQDDPWDAVAHGIADGIPLLHSAVATLQCDLHDLADGGDHAVVIGHVAEAAAI